MGTLLIESCMDRGNRNMHKGIDEAVRVAFGPKVGVKWSESVSGGDINEAYHVLLDSGEEVFLKLKSGVRKDFFAAEAYGLKCMKLAGANVPQVLSVGMAAEGKGFLLLSFVRSSGRSAHYGARLGQMLADMHQAGTKKITGDRRFGLTENNYIGETRQMNNPKDSWIEFFRDNRLAVQMRLADRYFDKDDRRMCRSLLDHLDSCLAEPKFPSLLHGDLWGGNVMPDRQGQPMLIDPAVYVGHHEADLAMTELFGGFSQDFYDSYHEIIPREPGYVERREIYNLYHLLNHLNLFGGSYLASVRRIIKKYKSF